MVEKYSKKHDFGLIDGSFRGVLSDLPNSKYHSLKNYYSSSQLKYIYGNSPFHFYKKYISKEMPEQKPSKDMDLGSAFHCATLTHALYDEEFFIMPRLDKRKPDERKIYNELKEKHDGKIELTAEQDQIANDMADAVIANEFSNEKLSGTKREISIFWRCPYSDLNLRARIDALGDSYFIELKSARSAHPDKFQRQIHDLHYELSLYHYYEGLKQTLWKNKSEEKFEIYFIAVEKTYPYVLQNYMVSDELLDLGHNKWMVAINRLDFCLETNNWYQYVDDREDPCPYIYPAKWAYYKEYEDESETLTGDDF